MRQEDQEQSSEEKPESDSTTPIPRQDNDAESMSDERQSPVREPLGGERNELFLRSGPTGPRSEAGKQRSSQNAIKSGIFSQANLVKDESRPDYELLLKELWEALQPEGMLEELLVGKLASTFWRYRRLLVADAAEFTRNSDSMEFIRTGVSETHGLDRLVRCESSLERTFERALTQLERIQRMRKGLTMPPQLDVKIS